MRQTTALIAAAAISTSASLFVSPAFAQEDMGSNPITEFFDGLGLSAKEKPDIDYQERAPLVPPTQTGNLPAPKPVNASRGEQWPNDPDVQARAERRARDNKLPTETYSYRMDREPRLDPDELGGGKRTRGASVPRTAGDGTRGDNEIMRADRDEMSGKTIREVPTSSNASAGRGRLTDPPAGYLVGNGVTAQAKSEEKPWYGRLFGN